MKLTHDEEADEIIRRLSTVPARYPTWTLDSLVMEKIEEEIKDLVFYTIKCQK